MSVQMPLVFTCAGLWYIEGAGPGWTLDFPLCTIIRVHPFSMLNAQWQSISETFKVHKHDIFLMNFFADTETLCMVPRACNTRFLKIVFDSAKFYSTFKHFRVCSVSDCEGHPSHAPSVQILIFKLIEKTTWTMSTSILFGFNTSNSGPEMHGKTLI